MILLPYASRHILLHCLMLLFITPLLIFHFRHAAARCCLHAYAADYIAYMRYAAAAVIFIISSISLRYGFHTLPLFILIFAFAFIIFTCYADMPLAATMPR